MLVSLQLIYKDFGSIFRDLSLELVIIKKNKLKKKKIKKT